MKRIAIIGCGTMGEAILGGLRGRPEAPQVSHVTTRRAAVAKRLADTYNVDAGLDNARAIAEADIVLLAVKPGKAKAVLSAPEVTTALTGKLLVSICAGVSLGQLHAWAPGAACIRAMPNTPALIGEGMTVLTARDDVRPDQVDMARDIFLAMGRCRVLEEKHMDAVTGLSGSGPAFACVILEALADGGVRMGLPRDVAVELAAQTFQGAARMVLQTGKHPAALKDEVTTPAGCTIAGLLTMEDGRIRSILARTIEEAAKTASGLGRE